MKWQNNEIFMKIILFLRLYRTLIKILINFPMQLLEFLVLQSDIFFREDLICIFIFFQFFN